MPAAPLPANRSRTRASAQVRLEDREQRLLDAIAERPRAGPGATSRMPRARAGDDPARVSHRRSDVTRRSPVRRPRRAQPAARQLRGERRVARIEPARVVEQASACRRARTASSRCSATWSDATRSRGKPLWASPRTSPSCAARSPSRPARSRRVDSATASSRASAISSVESDTRTQNDSTRAAPDPAAQLVELREPEPIGALDDHHRRLRDVDADLDDGRPDEHVELAVAEPGHLGVPLGRP